jgi:tetratricopeptide (TPR) repeat protein
VLASAACAALGACLSRGAADLQGFDKAPLYGMVYDDRNEPCQGALIHVDGSAGPRADLSGRFVVPDLARGTHGIAVEKAGFERLETTVDFFDKSQVLYLKVISLDQLLGRIEDALAQRRLTDAGALVARAEAVDGAHTDVRYLKAVYLLKSGEPRRAADLLEQLLAEGERAPALYLTLADVYQFALDDRDKAKESLAAYLRVQDDSQARSRLEALR